MNNGRCTTYTITSNIRNTYTVTQKIDDSISKICFITCEIDNIERSRRSVVFFIDARKKNDCNTKLICNDTVSICFGLCQMRIKYKICQILPSETCKVFYS